MVGFVYSIVGMKPERQVLQWSHMLGVLPEYRNSGLGRALKLEQRERALAQGYELVEWTYDPLQAMNAHLNFSEARRRGRGIPPQRLRRVDERAAQGHAHRSPGGAVVDCAAARRAAGGRPTPPCR